MDNPSRKSEQETSASVGDKISQQAPPQTADRGATSKTAQRPFAAFEDACAEFFHEVSEPVRNAMESQKQAYGDYVQNVQSLYEEGCRRLEEASRGYLKELQASQEAEDAQQRAVDAYQRFVQAQQTAFGPEEYLKFADAHNDYRQAVAGSFDPKAARGRSEEAFRRYLHAVKKAWSQVDPDSLDARSLAVIVNSLGAVASKAAGC